MSVAILQEPVPSTAPVSDRLLERIRGEFREMPCLTVTLRQASRLWNLDPIACDIALRILVEERFLDHTRRGAFRRAD